MLILRCSWIGVETMRASPKTIQPPRSELDKPAKQRIAEQADMLFTRWGVNISTEMIAHYAHTNVETIKKHFGTRERLVFPEISHEASGAFMEEDRAGTSERSGSTTS